MASSKTEIANLALSHLGVSKEIADLDSERSQEAGACRRFYELARDATLRDFTWPFAKKIAAMELVAEDPNDNWSYSYRYPTDCVLIRRILSGARIDTRQSRVQYDQGYSSAGTLIFTDEADAYLEYTVKVTNPALFPDDFLLALSYRLAGYIAMRVTGGDDFKRGPLAMQMYQYHLSLAGRNAGMEEQGAEEVESEFIRARDS